MASNKTDPRVVKTRTNLRKALVYLMRREKIEDISVQKITETANITRGTFYLHYKDKQDFIESAISHILDEFFDQVMVDSEDLSFEKGHTVQVFSLQKAFQYIEGEADLFDVLLNNKQNNFFYGQLYDRLSERLANYYRQIASPTEQLEVPLNLQISFIDSAFLGLVSHWLQDGMIYTPRYMTTSVQKMLNFLDSNNVTLVHFFEKEPVTALEDV
ncbi:TetR family transcriptional regulator [Limosilactobacillus frumenti DSM 13145]|uniref:TetR family transcriptional regulator n=1 Tax=Limosilactobacillus frumenti DSM 13145 TaxID=1423746 RepID=A0A0R1P4A3_9LACO|nr:TetR/AcrR family transcriptional regulator [Limosilactobacillus frumenti]KRL27361.1 TetR family transcriptional regulator [Limosilactobacillus frumenti DSM 13145]MBA2913359.1 TetR/AcrR family transcriptional regulator [Limosilactobacillus frumenti]QFG72807.1 TetR/AcrR family transcriptional regulator [Limosilactobacillus frumenti]